MRKLLTTVAATSMFVVTSFGGNMAEALDANAMPSLHSTDKGNVSINGHKMNVALDKTQGGTTKFNWNSFNVGKDSTVNFEFGAHNQTALNKVSAAGGMSQIYGKLTSSGCLNCGYEGTGKVVLLNPNGVFFANGSSVNLNSFTASSFNGVYDDATKKLELTRSADSGKIIVEGGASIYGDKNVALVAPDIEIYKGSLIKTNIAPNVDDTSYGKVKLVTADGVNFTYYNNGAIKQVADAAATSDKMTLYVAGTIESGNIDARNMSTNAGSEINLNGANLKAVKAVKGNDGNIYLTANNKVVVDDSTFTTANYSSAAASVTGGKIKLLSGNKDSVKNSTLNAVGDIIIESANGDSVVDSSNVTTTADLRIASGNIASLQNNSIAKAKNIDITGKDMGQVYKSSATADNNINLTGEGSFAWTEGSTLKAGNQINVTALNGSADITNTNMTAKDINVKVKNDLATPNFAGSTLTASNNVNLTSTEKNISLTTTDNFKPSNRLTLTAAENVELNYENGLEVGAIDFTAGNNVFLTSAKDSVTVTDKAKFNSAKAIYVQGANDVKTSTYMDTNGIQTNLVAGRDVNVKLKNVDVRDNGLVAKAGHDVTVKTDGTLSVSALIAGNDLTVDAKKVIAGKPYTHEYFVEEGVDRSYMEAGGKFYSNPEAEYTLSFDPTQDGNYNQRHHIQYENGTEKILLVNKKPIDKPQPPINPDPDPGAEVDPVKPGSNPGTVTPSEPPVIDPTPVDPTPVEPTPIEPTPIEPEEGCGEEGIADEIVPEDVPSLLSNSAFKSALLNTQQKSNIEK